MVCFIKWRDVANGTAIPALEVYISGFDTLLRQELCHSADIGVYGHSVVIKDNDHRLIASADIGKSLISKTASKRTVSDDGDNIVFFIFKRPCPRHSERK